MWTKQTVLFTTDNQATANIINKGRSKSLPIMSFLHRLVQLSLRQHCRHITGKYNIAADALSRFNLTLFFQQEPGANPTTTPVPPWLLLSMD